LRILGGAIEAPTFNLQNPLMVAKHIRSAILSELILRAHGTNGQSRQISETLPMLFPTFIRDYLLDIDDHFRNSPASVQPLHDLLAQLRDSLANKLVDLFVQYWPSEAAELTTKMAITKIIDDTPTNLD